MKDFGEGKDQVHMRSNNLGGLDPAVNVSSDSSTIGAKSCATVVVVSLPHRFGCRWL